ncbi:MAG: VWA domain-containing protein [Terracidiphilus sp.]|jgi:VWFA-related protein
MNHKTTTLGPLLCLCAATLAHSQAVTVPPVPPANEPQSAVTLRQNVNNVLIDVVVSDKNGQPVKGLARTQFQVLENGAPQQISFFEEHQSAPPPASPAHPLQLPPNVYTNFPTTAPDTGPILVLLMDALNTPSAEQVKVRLAMLSYLRQIPPGRRIAIFTLTGRLHMIQGFNSDPNVLTAALDQAAAWQKQSHLTDDPGQDSYSDSMPKLGIGQAATGTSSVLSNFIAHEQTWKTDERVGFTLDALDALGIYLSALPGRKNLIWFSGSFPIAIGSGSDVSNARNYEDALRKTTDLLTLARVAVYPMDPGALPTPSMFSSTRPNNGLLENSGATISQINKESADRISALATMDTIAESTGGRAFHSTNDLAGAINTVTELNSNYYTIAYEPADMKYDGKLRKLTVQVDAPKVKLDYRRGYYAQDPEKYGADTVGHPKRTTAVLLHGAPAATDILFKVRVAPTDAGPQNPQSPATHSGSKESSPIRYSVNWVVDLRGIPLPIAPNGIRQAAFDLVSVAYDSDGKARATTTTPVSLSLKPEEYASYLKTGLQFHQELDLPQGPIYLRVAVLDAHDDRAGATEIPLTIKPAPAQTSSAQPITTH